MNKIYEGFDNLDLAIDGTVKSRVIDALRGVKDDINNTDHTENLKVTLGGEPFLAYGTGARGGYAFHIKHDLGDFWFKEKHNIDWPVRVSIGSEGFAKYGSFDAVINKLRQLLALFCNEVTKESVSRVDYAIDYQIADHLWDPYKFAFKSFKGMNMFFDDPNESGFDFHMTNRMCTGVTFGKMPNRQLCIYDKTREIVKSKKAYWAEIWGRNKNYVPDLTVWRVECRAGKRVLKHFLKERSLKAIRENISSILSKTFENVKYKDVSAKEATDSNYSRVAKADVWEVIEHDFKNMQENVLPASTIYVVRQLIDQTLRDQVRKQAEGTLVTSAFMDGARTFDDLNSYIAEMYERILTMGEGDLVKRFEAVGNRYLADFERQSTYLST